MIFLSDDLELLINLLTCYMIFAVSVHWNAIGGWMYLISMGESSWLLNAKLAAKQQSIDAGIAIGSRQSSENVDQNKIILCYIIFRSHFSF